MFVSLVQCTTVLMIIYGNLSGIVQFQAVRVYVNDSSGSSHPRKTVRENPPVSHLLNQRKAPKDAKWQPTKNWCSPKRLQQITEHRMLQWCTGCWWGARNRVCGVYGVSVVRTRERIIMLIGLASPGMTQKRLSAIPTGGGWVVGQKDSISGSFWW